MVTTTQVKYQAFHLQSLFNVALTGLVAEGLAGSKASVALLGASARAGSSVGVGVSGSAGRNGGRSRGGRGNDRGSQSSGSGRGDGAAAGRGGGRSSSGRRGSGGASRGGRRRGRRRGGARPSEVDTAHVGLVDGASVPPPLEGAATRGRAGGGEGVRHRDGEGRLVGSDTRGSGGVDVPRDQGVNDRVLSKIDHGDVGHASVGRGNVHDHGDHLAGAVAVDGGGGGIAKLEAAALPEVALGGGEVGLGGADLGHGLDVAVGVGRHLVPDLRAACRLHGGAERTGRRARDTAVGRDAGGEEGSGGNLLVHLGGGEKEDCLV